MKEIVKVEAGVAVVNAGSGPNNSMLVTEVGLFPDGKGSLEVMLSGTSIHNPHVMLCGFKMSETLEVCPVLEQFKNDPAQPDKINKLMRQLRNGSHMTLKALGHNCLKCAQNPREYACTKMSNHLKYKTLHHPTPKPVTFRRIN